MEWIYPFDTTAMPELAEVGGKGMSLMTMTRLGMPVPAGLVFSAEFFQP